MERYVRVNVDKPSKGSASARNCTKGSDPPGKAIAVNFARPTYLTF